MSSNGTSQDDSATFPSVVELNVGGVFYTTSLSTLTKDPNSLLGQMFTGKIAGPKAAMRDSKGKYFIDRDGVLFRYILDYLRNQKLILPENFHERDRLKQEAEYFNLPDMVNSINSAPPSAANSSSVVRSGSESSASQLISGYISLGYRGSFAFGRDGLADVKFRKLTRILVNGKVAICREVFGDSLNESRDPDRCSEDRYTSRFFLKHTFLEQAFDNLQEAGFRCVGACGSGTSCGGANEPLKPGVDSEENRWNHYNEFIFVRP